MSAKIIKLKPSNPRRDVSVACIRIGPTQRISIFASNAAEIGVPLVELRCPYGEHINLTVDQAEKIAAGLIAAAAKARA